MKNIFNCLFLKNLFLKKPKYYKYLQGINSEEEIALRDLINPNLLLDDTLNNVAINRNIEICFELENNENAGILLDSEILQSIKHTGFSPYAIKLWDMNIENCAELIAFNLQTFEAAYKSLLNSENHNRIMQNIKWKYAGISIDFYKNKKLYCIILAY